MFFLELNVQVESEIHASNIKLIKKYLLLQ